MKSSSVLLLGQSVKMDFTKLGISDKSMVQWKESRVAFDATANVWSAMDQTTSTPVSSVDITDRRENAFQNVLLITISASIKAVESTVACPVTPVVSSVPVQHHSIVYCAKSTWCTWILMLKAKRLSAWRRVRMNIRIKRPQSLNLATVPQSALMMKRTAKSKIHWNVHTRQNGLKLQLKHFANKWYLVITLVWLYIISLYCLRSISFTSIAPW